MAVDGFNLVFQVIWALIVTQFLIAKQLFQHFLWSPRQKCVKGKVVVVTGAGHGLGHRIAKEFGKLGAHVVCWDIDTERNQNTVWDIKQANGKAMAVTCDVTDRVQVFKTVSQIRDDYGEIDILVSCVGVYPVQPTLAWTPQELYSLFDTNVMAQFWLLQAVVPHMKNRNSGHLAVMSSAAAIAPVPGELVYSVTKSAVTGLMDGFLQELQLNGSEGIKVTCIHPYYTAIRTDIPVKYDIRFERMSPDYVAGEIVKGIREEQEVISVPRFLLFWIHFMKLLPQSARRRWRDIFYTRVYPKDDVKYYTDSGEKINILELYKLPPLSKVTNQVAIELPLNNYNMNNNTASVAPSLQPVKNIKVAVQPVKEEIKVAVPAVKEEMKVEGGCVNEGFTIEKL